MGGGLLRLQTRLSQHRVTLNAKQLLMPMDTDTIGRGVRGGVDGISVQCILASHCCRLNQDWIKDAIAVKAGRKCEDMPAGSQLTETYIAATAVMLQAS
mmetsp:Transcript_115163/g.199838  ORF Transcript_115163/g.199838 Transcript_115163/m.199838 type:complete len:99 (-) Transcript_115163:75-371(-)